MALVPNSELENGLTLIDVGIRTSHLQSSCSETPSVRNISDNEITIHASIPPLRALIRLEIATVWPIANPDNGPFIRSRIHPHTAIAMAKFQM